MAQFVVEGLDGLIHSMEALENVTDEEWDGILEEQADYLATQLKLRGEAYGVGSGKLLQTIKPGKPKEAKNGGRQIVVAPRGKRVRGKKNPKTITNAQIAFHVNFGGKNTDPVPFWSDTVEISAETLQSIAASGVDGILKKRDL